MLAGVLVLLIERIDAYPEDWSSLFIEAVTEWRVRYDALTTEASHEENR